MTALGFYFSGFFDLFNFKSYFFEVLFYTVYIVEGTPFHFQIKLYLKK